MKKIEHEIKIKSDIQTIYQALTTLKGLESWHSAHVEGDLKLNGKFTLNHKEDPSFSWKIVALVPNKSVEWECIKGPNDAPGTHVWFNLETENDGRVLVECAHEGWPNTTGNYRKCNTLWGILLYHLKQFVETNTPSPTFN